MRKPVLLGLAVERAPHGLRVRGTQLYVDPVGRTQIGFLAHARGARATLPERTVVSARTLALLEASQQRALRKAAPLPAPRSISPRGVDDWTFGHSAFATLCRHHLKHNVELFKVRDFAPDFAQLLRQRFD